MIAGRDPLAMDILQQVDRLESMLLAGDREGLDSLVASLFPSFKSNGGSATAFAGSEFGEAVEIPQEVR